MGNRISLNLAKNIAKSLWGIFYEIPAARARKEYADADVREADADIRRTEAEMKKVQYYDRTLEFLTRAGFSKDEQKAIIVNQITSKSKHGNMIDNLKVIGDLVERNRINFQITGEVDECTNEEDG